MTTLFDTAEHDGLSQLKGIESTGNMWWRTTATDKPPMTEQEIKEMNDNLCQLFKECK